MLKVSGAIVTTPAAAIEVMSPDQVAPFKDDGPEVANALPAAAKNRNNSHTMNIFPVFIISHIPPFAIELSLYIRTMITIMRGCWKTGSPGAMPFSSSGLLFCLPRRCLREHRGTA
jgi:hypothetical protein